MSHDPRARSPPTPAAQGPPRPHRKGARQPSIAPRAREALRVVGQTHGGRMFVHAGLGAFGAGRGEVLREALGAGGLLAVLEEFDLFRAQVAFADLALEAGLVEGLVEGEEGGGGALERFLAGAASVGGGLGGAGGGRGVAEVLHTARGACRIWVEGSIIISSEVRLTVQSCSKNSDIRTHIKNANACVQGSGAISRWGRGEKKINMR